MDRHIKVEQADAEPEAGKIRTQAEPGAAKASACENAAPDRQVMPERRGTTGAPPGSGRQHRHLLQRIPLVYKLSLLLTFLVVACMGLLGAIIIHHQKQVLRQQIDEFGKSLVTHMAHSAKEPLLAEDQLALERLSTSFATGQSVYGTGFLSLEGQILSQAGAVRFADDAEGNNRLQQLIGLSPGTMKWEWQPFPSEPRQMVVTFIGPVQFQDVVAGYAVATFSQSTMEKSMRQTVQAITIATTLIILLGIGLAYLLSRRLSQPIDRLIDASRAVGEGEYTFKFDERRQDEIGQLMSAFNMMAQGMLEKTQVRDVLSRYLSAGVAREVLSNLESVELGGKRVEGTVLFADIVGFTEIAENVKPEELVTMLNHYFSRVTSACEMNLGTVDKYMGDGVMLVFGVPAPDEDHCLHAITCALVIQTLVDRENRHRERDGLFPVRFRMGLNTGTMLAGNMGSRQRMEYTVVGDTVNMASRLCNIAQSGQIVVSDALYKTPGIGEKVVASEHQSIRLRGIRNPVTTYLVEDLNAACGAVIEEQIAAILRTESQISQ